MGSKKKIEDLNIIPMEYSDEFEENYNNSKDCNGEILHKLMSSKKAKDSLLEFMFGGYKSYAKELNLGKGFDVSIDTKTLFSDLFMTGLDCELITSVGLKIELDGKDISKGEILTWIIENGTVVDIFAT